MPTLKDPTPKLKPGVIYSSDNGRLICLKCAGASAKYTGRDISGQRVAAVPPSESVEWFRQFGKPMSCERGCTTYHLPGVPSPAVASPPPFKFESQRFPGATMNRYGVIHWQGHEVSPSIRGMILREALAAGCTQAPGETLDIGIVWTKSV